MKNVTYVSAGAGSGKTYFLTEMLSSILENGEVKGENVMMTTFTELAAAELKRKAKAKLYSKEMVEKSEEVDMATIGNIHSVAMTFLEKYWYLLGFSPDINILTDEDKEFFLSQSLDSILSKDDVAFLNDVAETLVIPASGPKRIIDKDFWKAQVKSIVENARLYSIDSLEESRKASLSFTSRMRREGCDVPNDRRVVERELESFKRCFDSLPDRSRTERRKELISEAEQKVKYSKETLSLKDLVWFKTSFMPQFNINAINEFFSSSTFFSMLLNLFVSSNYWDYIDEYIRRVFSIAELWQKEYLDYKKRMRVIDFDDMERYFLILLDNPEVQEDIRQQYKVVFVDEYQDCSPIQVKMFDKISDLVQRSYWVGDLKQAIYSFRGTDTSLVQHVVEILRASEGFENEIMSKSWRSHKNLVSFANHAFSRVFSSTLRSEDVVLEATQKEEGPLSILDARAEADLYDGISRYILSLIKKGEKPSSIAVLFRTNQECENLSASLKVYGVKANIGSSVDLTNPILELFVSILSLIADSNDRLSKAKIARLSLKGATTSAVIDGILSSQEEDSYLNSIPLVEKTLGISDRIKDYPVSKIAETLVIELNLYDRVKEMANVESGKEILDSIIETAKEYERHALSMSLPATVNGLIIELSKDGGISIPGDNDGVNILTMHRSKGLEWKSVIIGSLADDLCSDKRILQEYFSVNAISDPKDVDRKVIRVLPWVFGWARTNFTPEIVENIPQEELEALRKKRTEEIKRLMYVAITRAKENLCLISDGKDSFRWMTNIGLQPSLRYDDESSFDFFNTEDLFTVLTPPLVGETISDDKENLILIEDGEKKEYGKKDIQPSSIPPLEEVRVSMEKDFSSRIQVSSNADPALIGTAIHDVFCVLEKNKDIEFISSIIESHGFRKEIPNSDEVLRAWNNLESYLKEQYGEEYTTLHECPFRYEEDSFEINGSIDLVWETKEGAVLIDYKTFQGKKNSILDPGDSHYAGLYSGQFSAYRKALEKAGRKVLASFVYYPVAGCLFRIEW